MPPKREATARCIHCSAERIIPMEQYEINQTLQPFAGGGNYGRCLRCKRAGLKIVKIPEVAPLKPVGWRRIPT